MDAMCRSGLQQCQFWALLVLALTGICNGLDNIQREEESFKLPGNIMYIITIHIGCFQCKSHKLTETWDPI